MANIARHIPSFPRTHRFDPVRDIEDMMNNFWMRPLFSEMMEGMPQIKIDVTENDQAYTVYAEMPGVKKEDIRITLEGNRVSISAEVKEEMEKHNGDKMICHERYQGREARSFMLESEVDESKAQAKYTDGVLELTLPKKMGGAVSKQIKIV